MEEVRKNNIKVKRVMEKILEDPKIEVVENRLKDVYYAVNNNPRRYDDFKDFMII
ncbi:hypothetical protein [Saccharolobus sp. A20]|uniref:hypothetical protein n=1 Tax=Saccharolobus sp. A20 TaxID=1891280 RepID=UPI0018D44481|nr:hypothetical protein [Sulfolobus sp. A20]